MPQALSSEGLSAGFSWGGIALPSDGSPLALSFGCTGAEAPRSVGTDPENVSGVVNGSISLVCDIQPHPAAEITWYKDGHVLRPGEEVTVTRGMLG